ncbi:hypothetical protein EDD37DRAFT_287263 [Exophiala viscosa]|uniref:uncharacterized protein n=1 Tax=Exophiala viscosa TaxID=2486360 RepID=UPI0021A01C79|nr:hypothetical protein EDD37DRAFT_287263 [Exophiala viscosa]
MRSSILACFFASAALVASFCCDDTHIEDDGAHCADGTYTGVGCCSYGPCNIFCCNCDAPCRQASTRMAARDFTLPWESNGGDPTCGLFQTENQCALDKFQALDANKDGILTLSEVLADIEVVRPFINSFGLDNATITKDITLLFNTYDVDKNGNLTFAEVLTPQVVDTQA